MKSLDKNNEIKTTKDFLPEFLGLEANLLDLEKKKIEDAGSTLHILAFRKDVNNKLRDKDFCDCLLETIIDYVIPRSERNKVLGMTKRNFQEISKLQKRAKSLFIVKENSGEIGELILYYLTSQILETPQLISKMSLKTNRNIPFHGADAIHFCLAKDEKTLEIFWGESKMHSDFNSAITGCLEGLSEYLIEMEDRNQRRETDIGIILANSKSHLDDEHYSNLICSFLDKNNKNSLNLKFKGVGFVSCDTDSYNKILENKNEDIESCIKRTFKEETLRWIKNTKSEIVKIPGLLDKDIYLFLIPFDSVSNFRRYFCEKFHE